MKIVVTGQGAFGIKHLEAMQNIPGIEVVTLAGGNPAGTEEVLRVEHLRRGKAIRDVSFSVRKGEILGFAGLMGAGRTEVARALIGADPAKVESIKIHGKEFRLINDDSVEAVVQDPRGITRA